LRFSATDGQSEFVSPGKTQLQKDCFDLAAVFPS
jgi:hypothetical protein